MNPRRRRHARMRRSARKERERLIHGGTCQIGDPTTEAAE